MPDFAKRVTLDLKQRKMFVDGDEFPWYISEEGPTFNALADHREMRQVTVTFMTEDVEIIPENAGESA